MKSVRNKRGNYDESRGFLGKDIIHLPTDLNRHVYICKTPYPIFGLRYQTGTTYAYLSYFLLEVHTVHTNQFKSDMQKE